MLVNKRKKLPNVEVIAKKGEDSERLIKRFLKKFKKSGIIEEYIEKTHFFMTKSQKRRQKRIKNHYLRQKDQK